LFRRYINDKLQSIQPREVLMSHAAAQHLASYGRGGDTELVHMTKGEIKGLHALALAHGGSLTINPDTGLVEAGFLKKILPMLAGAALSFIPGVGPLAAAALVGGGTTLATGSIEKGLMAGLGAWGGAGLAGSLGSLGAGATAEAAGQAATQGFAEANRQAVTSGLGEAATANLQALNPGVAPSEFAREIGTQGFNLPAGGLPSTQSIATQAAQGYLTPANLPGLSPETLQQYQASLNAPGVNPQDVIGAAGRAQGAAGATTAGNITAGLKAINPMTEAGRTALGSFAKENALTLAGMALPALADNQKPATPGYTEDEYDRYLKGFRMSPNFQAYEAPRPNPYYRAQYPTYAAEGGIMKLQNGGGPVERMSMMNTAMNPQGGLYPQGMIDKTQYATPIQRPVSSEMVMEDSAYERSNPMLMAEGGIARYRNKGQVNVLQDYIDRQERQLPAYLPESVGVPRTGIYRDTDVDTARKDALTASMIRLGKAGKGAGIKTVALPKTSIRGLGDISGATQDTTEAAAGGTMRYNLGGYSDGGRMLKGPGDGMSDSIPATIAGKQPARLADGEFVVPADVVSHLGNGSTDAGAKKLYGMMDKIRKARTGKKKQAPAVKASRYMPA
jgi:hypothetical protein